MGMPSFRRVLDAVAETWASKRDEIVRQGEQIREMLAQRPTRHGRWRGCRTESLERAVEHLGGQFDPREWRFRRRAKVSAGPVIDFLLRASTSLRRSSTARHGFGNARADGPRRYPRPGRRRISPVCGRRMLAGPAFREDALRQRAARAALPGCLPDHRARLYRRTPSRRSITCSAR